MSLERFLDIFGGTLLWKRSQTEHFEAFPDPEGFHFLGRSLVRPTPRSSSSRVSNKTASSASPPLERDPWLAPLRCDPRFVEVLRRAESRTLDAARAFEDHAGSRVIGGGVRSAPMNELISLVEKVPEGG